MKRPVLVDICVTLGVIALNGCSTVGSSRPQPMSTQDLEEFNMVLASTPTWCGSGKCDVQPKLVVGTYPVIPHAGAHTKVVIVFEIQSDGSTDKYRIESTPGPEYTAAALATLHSWKFSPAMRNGVSYPFVARIPFDFPEW